MNSLPKIKGTYKKNFPLSKLTWFQTGGKAQVLLIPKDLSDLQFFLKNINNISRSFNITKSNKKNWKSN